MPQAGDNYTVTLNNAHLNWGTLSRTGRRRRRNPLEVYIKIPSRIARHLIILRGIYYDCCSSDGIYNRRLRASGSQGPDRAYAKNFESEDHLYYLGEWLINHCHAVPGDEINIFWDSPTHITLTYIDHHSV